MLPLLRRELLLPRPTSALRATKPGRVPGRSSRREEKAFTHKTLPCYRGARPAGEAGSVSELGEEPQAEGEENLFAGKRLFW